ncbi:hypothetical protein B296_00024825 [Ensete ventricosum]|uniref:Uncharacterized protein n=1 Tax=Ensete ventricosum TaxID=4639 RepID=A0A426YMB5_ENSVE|nr:hypothetical protein B296_00024825 [Ensete ventricosum]
MFPPTQMCGLMLFTDQLAEKMQNAAFGVLRELGTRRCSVRIQRAKIISRGGRLLYTVFVGLFLLPVLWHAIALVHVALITPDSANTKRRDFIGGRIDGQDRLVVLLLWAWKQEDRQSDPRSPIDRSPWRSAASEATRRRRARGLLSLISHFELTRVEESEEGFPQQRRGYLSRASVGSASLSPRFDWPEVNRSNSSDRTSLPVLLILCELQSLYLNQLIGDFKIVSSCVCLRCIIFSKAPHKASLVSHTTYCQKFYLLGLGEKWRRHMS